MPAAFASSRAGLRASGSFGLKTIASTPLAIRSRMSWQLAGGVRVAMDRGELGDLAGRERLALAVQTCSSRKPLPTPPPFE